MNKEQNVFIDRFNEIVGADATQEEIAQKIGTSRQNVGNWLSGKSKPDINMLAKIATAYEVSTDYLLGRTTIKSDNPTVKDISELTGLSEENTLSLMRTYFSKPAMVVINEVLAYTMENYEKFTDGFFEMCKNEIVDNLIIRELNEKEWNNKYSENILRSLKRQHLTMIGQHQYDKYREKRLEECNLQMDYQGYLYSEFLISLFFDNMKSELKEKLLKSEIKSHIDEMYSNLFAADNDADRSLCRNEIHEYRIESHSEKSGIFGKKI